jgi:hypothetical protein
MARRLGLLRYREFDDNGDPLVGGLLYSYEAGTTTPKVTYADADGATPNTNPVVLDSAGKANVYLGTGNYKLILKTPAGVTVDTQDDVNLNPTAAEDGLDGRTILYGSEAPEAGDGNDGDFYLDSATYDLYGPKASGTWPAGVSLTGQADAAAASEAAAALSEIAAAASESAAAASEAAAALSETAAETAETNAETAETNAEAAQVAAEAARDAALAAQSSAEDSEDAAAISETNAAASALAASTFDPDLYFALAGRASPQTATFGTGSGAEGILTSTSHGTKGKLHLGSAGAVTFDEVNGRLGIGTATPAYRLTIKATADNYNEFPAIYGTGSTNHYVPYVSASGGFNLINIYQGLASINILTAGQVGLAGGNAVAGRAVNIRSHTSVTTDITLGLLKRASQTADAFAYFDTDDTTKLARIDVAGAATFSGLTVDGTQVSGLIRQNSQSAAYTTVLADSGKHILHPTADNNARTFTIDSNANVAYPIGTAITFVNEINTVTIAITSDTMTLAGAGTTGSRTLAANGMATALKIGTTNWIISGSGLT